MTTPPPSPSGAKRAKARPARAGLSRKRRLLRLALVTLALALVFLFVAARSGVARYAVLPSVASNIHADIQADRVVVDLDGSIVLRNARFTAPGQKGVASRFFEVDRARIWIDWGAALSGSPRVTRVELDRPHLRVSQDVDTGRLNIADVSLLGLGGKSDAANFTLPTLVARSGIMELGEHGPRGYATLRALPFAGLLEPRTVEGRPGYSFHIQQVHESDTPEQQPIELSGRIDEAGIDLTLHGVNLEDWSADAVPSRYRDVYKRLDLVGRVRPTTFHMDPDGSVLARLSLESVAVNLPFDKEGNLTSDGPLARMTDTSGSLTFRNDRVEAEFRGLLDTLAYNVSVTYLGTSLDSTFICRLETNFRLEEDMDLLLFAPDEVLEKLEMFSSPTADVSAAIDVMRDAPVDGVASPIKIFGEIDISNGAGAFSHFPYPFHDLSAKVEFDRQSLTISRIKGVSPTGAKLTGSAHFEPLGEQAAAKIDLHVEDAPIDDTLREALNAQRVAMLDELFSRDRYDELLDAGLVTPAGDGPWGPDQASLADNADAPAFELGGVASVDISLNRDPTLDTPSHTHWSKHIVAHLPRGGVLPKHFPLPLLATGVTLDISDAETTVTGGMFRPLRGGSASVEARVDLAPDAPHVPVITIVGHDIPIDDLALNAIPGVSASKGVLADQRDTPGSLDELIDRLNLGGSVDCWADIAPRADGSIGYDVETSLFDVRAVPKSVDDSLPPLELQNTSGTIYVREDVIIVDLAADATPITDDPDRPSTRVELFSQIESPPGQRWGDSEEGERGPALYAEAKTSELNPEVPIEHFVGVFSPEAANALAHLNAEHEPRGRLPVRARVVGELGERVRPEIEIGPVGALDFLVRGREVRLQDGEGVVRIDAGPEPAIHADALSANVVVGGEPGGRLTIDGSLPLVRPGERPPTRADHELVITLNDAPVASPLSRALVAEAMGAELLALYDEHEPAGEYSLDLRLTPDPSKPPYQGDGLGMPPLSLAGSLEPRTLSFATDSGRVQLEQVSGRFELRDTGGTIEGLEARSRDWSLRLDGGWDHQPDGGLDLHADAELDAKGTPEDLLALLPGSARALIEDMGLRVAGSLHAPAMRVTLSREGADGPISYDFTGAIDVTGAGADVGMPITDAAGRIDFEASSADGGRPAFRVDVLADHLRAGGIRLSNAHARFRSGDEDSVVLVPIITADVHGGRLAGTAQIHEKQHQTPPVGPVEPPSRRYWADMQISRARAAPLLEDLGAAASPLPDTTDWSEPGDLSRGLLDASISISATMGDPSSRIGRGTAIVSGGRVVEMPLMLQLIEFSNLQAPLGRSLDLAQADYYIQGDHVTFENISVFSPSVELFGYGTMRWPASDLDLVFRSQAVRPVPFLSDLVEGIRDELVTTHVRGTPPDLSITAEQFRGTKGVVRALLGGEDSEQQKRLRRIEREARLEHDRARQDAKRVASALKNPDTVGVPLPARERGFDNMPGGASDPEKALATEPTDPPIGEDN
ncbi:MAG: hypothetical protein R3B57_13280 [Phycisphaerales bacterium]